MSLSLTEEQRYIVSSCVFFQSLKNKDPIFEVNVEADSFKPEVTGHREEEIDAEGRYHNTITDAYMSA